MKMSKDFLEPQKTPSYKAIEVATAGKKIGDIGYAVQNCCEAEGYGVVRELTGHGIGKEMHEAPTVPNFGRRGNGITLKTDGV